MSGGALEELGVSPEAVEECGIYQALLKVIDKRNLQAHHGTLDLVLVEHSDKVCFVVDLYLIILLQPQIAEVLVEMPDAHNGFQEVCHLLRRLQPLLKARRFLDEKELDLLETLCLEVGVVFPRVFKGSVAPKIHDLVFHLPRIARHLGTVGGVREDNLESKHAIGNSLRRRLACVRAEEEKLKLMLQLDEVQLRLKSAEFSKPATRRIRKLNNETG